MTDPAEIARGLWERFRKTLIVLQCSYFHGGGHIERDELGRINWRCATCGRWSSNPVPLREESVMVRQHLKEADDAR